MTMQIDKLLHETNKQKYHNMKTIPKSKK